MPTKGGPTASSPLQSARNRQRLFLVVLCAAYGIAVAVEDGLHQPLFKDEKHFWHTVQVFQGYEFPPSIEELRSYPEVLTPLSFVVWSQLEDLTGAGPFGGRLLNLVLSFAVVCIIALRRRPDDAALLAGVGMLLYPYTLPLSVHLYTDVLAVFLVLLGTALYAHRQPVFASVFLALAIATRQYMLAVPTALTAWALIEWIRGRHRQISLWLAPAAAAATIFIWFLVFGGLGPSAGMEKWVPLFPAPMLEFFNFIPGYGLYVLTLIGAFFVIPEFLLYRRWRTISFDGIQRGLIIAAVLGIAYATFPPMTYTAPMGALDRVIRPVAPNDFIRMLVFYGLALTTCLRFTRLDLAFWILLVTFFMNMKAQLAWEKYAFPTLAVLWYLKSIHALDGGRFPLPRREQKTE
jgi:hypothetical protein